MGLTTPETVQKLQATLHAKAKRSPECRFHALYDKIYRADILAHAYDRCRSNGGAAGVDGVTFDEIKSSGVEPWLGELAERLRKKTYRPDAVRRVMIPKATGGQRPLGIPTIADRVVQMAAVLVLEPIFEADLMPEQHAYRPGRNALDAVRAVHGLVNTGHREVVDADLSGYFDSIPHGPLLQSVARRVSDGTMLHLIKMWLEMPVEEEDDRGRKQRTARHHDERRGTPQGAPISPLLSNLYMRRFILGWKRLGYERQYGARIVNYADDLVICCQHNAASALESMATMMGRLGLTLNETKTHICHLPEESVDFLGYTIGRCYSRTRNRHYLGTWPARTRERRVRKRVHDLTARRTTWQTEDVLVSELNRVLRGWANYFCLGSVSAAYRRVQFHTNTRLRRWLSRKHRMRGRGYARYPDRYLHEELGLIDLQVLRRNFAWAKA
jgi:group II intron reverse transcriptase/maturase